MPGWLKLAGDKNVEQSTIPKPSFDHKMTYLENSDEVLNRLLDEQKTVDFRTLTIKEELQKTEKALNAHDDKITELIQKYLDEYRVEKLDQLLQNNSVIDEEELECKLKLAYLSMIKHRNFLGKSLAKAYKEKKRLNGVYKNIESLMGKEGRNQFEKYLQLLYLRMLMRTEKIIKNDMTEAHKLSMKNNSENITTISSEVGQ